MQTSQWKAGVIDWHDEMSAYIKSIDAFSHPVTTSSDQTQLEAMDGLNHMDILQYHLYNTNLLSEQTEQDKNLLGILVNKAVINGEYGLNVSTADVPFDAQRIAIWTGIMSRVPHIMWKWDNYTDPVWGALFETPAAYLEGEDFAAEGALANWPIDAKLNAASLTGVGFRSNQNFYGVAYHPSFVNNIATASLTVAGLPPAHYNATFYDAVTGATSDTTLTAYPHATPFTLPTFSHAVAFKLKFDTEITAPIANAGPDLHASAGAVLHFSGENSYNPAGTELTYQWTLTDKPVGSAAALGSTDTQAIVFTPDLFGEYLLTLVVSNSTLSSEPDQVIVTVDQVTGVAIEQSVDDVITFPNPTSARTTVMSRRTIGNIQLLNATGETVWSRATINSNSIEVDLLQLGLPSGIYLIQVNTGSGTVARKVLFINTSTK
ncbi:MAG: T9SS type A sorting domain-containing protein [Bacteroidia bacterium]|nr:T9SS type A sorting domain-containing protein [Bacteroidia bacterium]